MKCLTQQCNHKSRLIQKSLVALIFFVSTALYANELKVNSAHTFLKNDLFFLNASIQYTLTPSQIRALHNGLSALIKFRVEFRRKRPIMDEEITKLNQRYIITYRALTKDYHIKNLNSGAEFLFYNLQDALKTLGQIRDYPLIHRNIFDPTQSFNIRLRAHTEVIDLPITVKLINYFSDKWSQTSDWFKWPLKS